MVEVTQADIEAAEYYGGAVGYPDGDPAGDCLRIAFARHRASTTPDAEPVAPAVVEALEWCADDLEAEIRLRWIEPDTGLPHPANKHRYDRDMEPVRKARAALAAMGERS